MAGGGGHPFAATCERCGDTQVLTPNEQETRIGYNGSFVCDSCGGTKIKVVRERPVKAHRKGPPVKRARLKPVEPEPVEPSCFCVNGNMPTYFRRCPDCPIQS